MPGTRRVVKRIDLSAPVTVGAVVSAQASDFASPARPLPDAPDNLALTTTAERNAATPTARISATWTKPTGIQPERYTIQWSEDASFPDGESPGRSAEGPSATIPGLKTATLYYVRVSAWVNNVQGAWSSMSPLVTGENRITTASDTVPASQPDDLAGTWIGTGDLLITWTNPPEENFKEVELQIFASSGGTLLRTVTSGAGRFVYTTAMNLADTGGAGDSSLYVEARSRTFSNVTNDTGVPTLTTAKPAPDTPTVTHSWSGETEDNGVAGADLTINWTTVADARTYRLTLDGGTAREISATRYTYPLDTNRADHAGTPDATISYSLVAVDGLNQVSTAPASGTATNWNPPAPTVTVTGSAIGTFALARVTSTLVADFAAYEYVWKRDGATVVTKETASSENVYEMSAAADSGLHSWTCVVRQKDAFGQYSDATTSSAVEIDALTLLVLRSDVVYSDSEGTLPATLKSQLADNNTTSGGVTYAA